MAAAVRGNAFRRMVFMSMFRLLNEESTATAIAAFAPWADV